MITHMNHANISGVVVATRRRRPMGILQKRLPLGPPHLPSSPTATSNATQAQPQRPLLSPLVDADADDSA